MSPILGIWASSRPAIAPDTGAMFPLQVITVGPAGASDVTFTNIPSTYTHLQIRCFSQTNRATYGSDILYMQINGATGSSYSRHRIYGDGTSAVSDADANTTAINAGGTLSAVGGGFGASVVDILDYANTNKYKTVRTLGGGDHNGTIAGFGGVISFSSGLYFSNTAITSMKFYPVYGTLLNANSQFALYGIKGA